MNFLRNTEIKKELLFFFLLAIFVTALYFFSDMNGLYCSLMGVAGGALLHFVSTWLRYRKISSFSTALDKILHGKDITAMAECREGELSILQYEINQVLLKLQEQTDALKQDKIFLADSLADVSHQLKTPLTSIHLILSLLNEPDITEERRRQLLNELRKLTERLQWLIDVLLKISKLDAGTVNFHMENILVKEVVDKVVTPLEIPMELKEQKLKLHIPEDTSFYGDIRWTTEALVNIMKNCMEHTPEYGTISVQCEENPLYTEIVVEDNGPGLDEKDIPRLFERFYKGKQSSADSVGIGLALARMIVMQQNGTIKAENRGRKTGQTGARFEIRFYKAVV